MNFSLSLARFPLRIAALIAVMLTLLASPVLAFKVTGGLTGWWEQTDEQNHGLIIAISRLPGGDQTGVVFWAHYDDEGNPTWLLAQGPLRGNVIKGDLYQVDGVGFMQPKGMSPPAEEIVGTLDVAFEDCNQGSVSYDAPSLFGSGNFDIQRLTTVPGMDCTGGVSDNVPPSARPERFEIKLEPSLEVSAARGEVEWMMTPGIIGFEVEIEDVAADVYDLFVGGDLVGTITAVVDDDDTLAEGEIEFSSPQRGDKLLLDFDVLGQTIEVQLNGEVVLSAVAPDEGEEPGKGMAPGFDDDSIEIEMTNTNVYSDGEARLELERDRPLVSFEIEVDDIPAGDYPVLVDTREVGVLTVDADEDGDTEGELEFRRPATAGYPVLNFDPRGALIEVVEGNTTLFFADFPEAGDDSDRPGMGPGPGNGPGPDLEINFDLPKVSEDLAYSDASAEARLDIDEDGRELEIEIEDVPAGFYPVRIDGELRGEIEAVLDDDDEGSNAEGEIEFSSSSDGDELLLNFPVRGALIEILDGNDTVVFSGTLPTS